MTQHGRGRCPGPTHGYATVLGCIWFPVRNLLFPLIHHCHRHHHHHLLLLLFRSIGLTLCHSVHSAIITRSASAAFAYFQSLLCILLKREVCIGNGDAGFPYFPTKNMYFGNRNVSENLNTGMGWNGNQQMWQNSHTLQQIPPRLSSLLSLLLLLLLYN